MCTYYQTAVKNFNAHNSWEWQYDNDDQNKSPPSNLLQKQRWGPPGPITSLQQDARDQWRDSNLYNTNPALSICQSCFVLLYQYTRITLLEKLHGFISSHEVGSLTLRVVKDITLTWFQGTVTDWLEAWLHQVRRQLQWAQLHRQPRRRQPRHHPPRHLVMLW